jgi:hypothetical protein
MPQTTITEKETTGRVTGYGDRVVEAGDRATATPAAPAPGTRPVTTSAPALPTVEVFLIDPKGLIAKSLRASIATALEKDLNALYATPVGKQYAQAKWGAQFAVTYRGTSTSKEERSAFGPLQYAIYLFNGHTPDAATAGEIEAIMKEHGIRDAGGGKEQFEAAREGWNAKSVEGLGIQPLEGYRKVGFVKADKIYAARGDREITFRNILKHELGHMWNMKKHTDQVMREGIVLADGTLDYSEAQTRMILQEIVRLQTKSAAELQANYERANR